MKPYNLKMPRGLFDTLAGAIQPADTPERREVYRKGMFARAHAVRDLDKRYRWDLLRICVSSRRICDVLYTGAGLSDDHIDTALRRIVPPLGN